MPPRLSKPENVPSRLEPLIEMLWRFHAAARSPSNRKIADVVASMDERVATANHETVRRTLKGTLLPQWETVEVIFLALCEIADVDPEDVDDDDDGYDRWERRRTYREELDRCYQLAKYGVAQNLPKTRAQRARVEEEAARERTRQQAAMSRPGGFNDEPPF